MRWAIHSVLQIDSMLLSLKRSALELFVEVRTGLVSFAFLSNL